jgi:NAD(P)-dependent dehydrogenase (short-subunit alcohol dehydrogenase family)
MSGTPTALVTGGTRGIGAMIASRLLAEGYEVVAAGRRRPDAMPRSGDRVAHFLSADIRNAEAVAGLVGGALDVLGRLDLLVNNAGGTPFAEAATASPRLAEKIIALNLTAPFHLSVAAYPALKATRGSIVNIASVSGTRPSPGTAAYGAAKAGLLNLTQTLAVEWAPEVRVNAVTAGLVRTEAAGQHYGDEATIARVAATVPLGRFATPTDIAEAVVFLASDRARYITGSQLLVHGGGEQPAFLTAVQAGG